MNRETTKRPRRPGRPASGREGFTIIETVIALCIAMVVGFGAVSLFLFSMNFNAGASDRARALALAQQRIETYRSTAYAGLAAADTTEQVAVGSTTAGKSDLRTFTVKTKVEYFDTTAGIANDQRPWRITVTVTPASTGRFTAGGVTLTLLRASDKFGAN